MTEVEALRVVRQRNPLLPLALCRALRDPCNPFAAISVDNVELCLGMIDDYVVWHIACANQDAALLEWAIAQQLSQRNLCTALRQCSAPLLAVVLRHNLHLAQYDGNVLEVLATRGCPLYADNASSGKLIDAMIAVQLPVEQALTIMHTQDLEAAPRHAAYLSAAIGAAHPRLASALLGAGLWTPRHGINDAFVRSAIRQQRLHALDAALRLAPPVDADKIAWLDEAPTLAIYEALWARGLRHADNISVRECIAQHLAWGGDVALTERMIAIGRWPQRDVLSSATYYGCRAIVEWLAARAEPAALDQAKRVFDLIAHDDYLQRAQAQDVWAIDSYLKQLAWVLDNPAARGLSLHPALECVSFVHGYRARRLIELDVHTKWLLDPQAKKNNDSISWTWAWRSCPSLQWALELCTRLGAAFPVELIRVCPRHLRRRLLEHALASGLLLTTTLANELAHCGDVELLHSVRQRGCPWDFTCHYAAGRRADKRTRDYLDAHEAPAALFGNPDSHYAIVCIESDVAVVTTRQPGNQTSFAKHHPLSDNWTIVDNTLQTSRGAVCAWPSAASDVAEDLLIRWALTHLCIALRHRGYERSIAAVQHIARERKTLAWA